MTDKSYINYSAEELLQDDFFVKSQLHPTEETELFWRSLLLENPSLAHEVSCAKVLLASVPYRENKLSATAKEELWSRIKATNIKNKRKSSQWYLYASLAASVALLFIVGKIFYGDYSSEHLTGIESVMKPAQATDEIQLILADKKGMNIDDENSKLSYNQKGELSINSKKATVGQTTSQEGAYNQLIVPSAKRSFLELSDGTKIWVNANTRVVYPVTFSKETREIYVDGEIYLEVSPNKQRPFIVKTKAIDVYVLGTSFNVSARDIESEASVVLVTGKVKVGMENQKTATLHPREMLSFNKGHSKVDVVNVDNYISWKDGVYTFDDEKFSTILHKLSTYYGRKFIADSKSAALHCSGTLSLQDDLNQIIKGLEATVPVLFADESGVIKVSAKP